MSKRDYYQVLGVSRGVDGDELKRAYRRLAVKYHPDRNPGDKEAEETFKELSEAYSVLSDSKKRATYDRFGHAGMGQGGGFGGGFEGGFSGSFTDIFDNIFGDIFNQGGGPSAASGIDLRFQMQISFTEAAFGVERDITFERENVCDSCQGTGAEKGTDQKTCHTCQGAGQVRLSQGFFTLARTCPTCRGRGRIVEHHCTKCKGAGRAKKEVTLNVNIPAGIDTGQRLRLRGEGEMAEPNGMVGDLYVEVAVKEHPLFSREGEHVLLELPITFVTASLGGDVDVPTLKGKETIRIAAGTQTGTLLRLRGKGIKRLNGSGFGDELIKVVVETPTRLSQKQKGLLKQFEEESQSDAQPGISNFIAKFRELFNQ